MSVPTVSIKDRGRHVVFCRLPGLLTRAAKDGRVSGADSQFAPLIISEGRIVRDACPAAVSHGVRVGVSGTQARRLCPTVLNLPLETVEPQRFSIRFLDYLADVTPAVEPIGPDSAFADLVGSRSSEIETALAALSGWASSTFGLPPVIGFGPSRNAARACAECGLLPAELARADTLWLWPEDKDIPDRLKRLGLATYGAVAALPESALVHQFGKSGRFLWRRAHGMDLTPVCALYPPPRADAALDLSESPVEDRQRMDAALSHLSARAADQLRQMGRHGRRVVLRVSTEYGEERYERVLSLPVQAEVDVNRVVRALARQMHPDAPIVSLRLLVDDTELPAARSLSLFPDKTEERDKVLRALRRTLHQKFGTNALLRLSELPISARDERRTLIREAFGAR